MYLLISTTLYVWSVGVHTSRSAIAPRPAIPARNPLEGARRWKVPPRSGEWKVLTPARPLEGPGRSPNRHPSRPNRPGGDEEEGGDREGGARCGRRVHRGAQRGGARLRPEADQQMATATYLSSSFSSPPPPSSRARLWRQTTRAAASAATDRPREVLSPKRRLPLRKVSGDYGPPVLGAVRDRFEYFYGPGGRDGFFASRVRAHGSTVVRLNMPPGPFVARDPRMVALLDAASFPVLFDTSFVKEERVSDRKRSAMAEEIHQNQDEEEEVVAVSSGKKTKLVI
jgi:hypothetical protein